MRRGTFGVAVCAGTLLALLSAGPSDAQAQSAIITGRITGTRGEALGGAAVLIDELGIAVATTVSGSYTLTVPADKAKGQSVTLRARYIGYSPAMKQIIQTASTQEQNLELRFDLMTLDAVVVTEIGRAHVLTP